MLSNWSKVTKKSEDSVFINLLKCCLCETWRRIMYACEFSMHYFLHLNNNDNKDKYNDRWIILNSIILSPWRQSRYNTRHSSNSKFKGKLHHIPNLAYCACMLSQNIHFSEKCSVTFTFLKLLVKTFSCFKSTTTRQLKCLCEI